MSRKQNTDVPVQPVYIMQPQPQQQDNDIFGGLGGIILSAVAGVLLGQLGLGGGMPRIPKL